jgi:hypothetical protein
MNRVAKPTVLALTSAKPVENVAKETSSTIVAGSPHRTHEYRAE